MDPRIAAWTCALLLLAAPGCSHSESVRGAAAPVLPTPPDSRQALVTGICDIDPASCANAGRARSASTSDLDVQIAAGTVGQAYSTQSIARRAGSILGFGGGSSPSSSPPSPQLPSGGSAPGPTAMIQVEARFAIQSDNLTRSADRFRQLARAAGGAITLDTESLATNASEATFEVRVPLAQYDTIVSALDSVGSVRAREVKATDVAKQFHDEELLLSNQEAALKRYEELLKEAKTVTDVMAVEAQVDRLRAQIDRLKGDLLWIQDKVARSTLRVRIYASDAAAELVPDPVTALYPGARFVTLFDLRGGSQTYGYAGAGLSLAFRDALGIHFGRAFVLELDLAETAFTTPAPGSRYAFLALAGSDFYSDRLGGGRRRFLNPYLGWRMGYADSEAHGDFVAGGIVGLDLLKTKTVFVDLHVRALGLVGSDLGPHAVIAPGLGANVAF